MEKQKRPHSNCEAKRSPVHFSAFQKQLLQALSLLCHLQTLESFLALQEIEYNKLNKNSSPSYLILFQHYLKELDI